jgi:murein DD-endopeptidase MepM/ murein hydrolase activator NlpD
MAVDGDLALDRHELWDEPLSRPRLHVSRSRLIVEAGFATVPAMSRPAPARARAMRRHHLERERRRRRLALLVVLAAVAIVIVLLSAFGGSGRAPQVSPVLESPTQLLPAGPPTPEIVSKIGALHLQLPINQSRVTAIGFANGSDGSLALDPVGVQANEGLVKRLVHDLVGGASGGPRWYQLAGGATSALDVGAPAGTDVYSPVDGTVVAIDRVILNGRRYGSTIELQPSGAPSLVVSVSHLRLDPSLVVGSPVSSGGTRLGQVLDFSHAERQALAHYTNDAGNHVVIEVHPAATLQLP